MTEAQADPPKKPILFTFPRSFWVANVMELFERAAYYGMNAVLGRYLTDKVGGGLGFGADQAGFLQGIVYAATYILPILGGALADRYGYRRMLLFSFSILSVGYFATGYVTAYGAIFATLLLMAVGSGLFKPIISGTIARTTNEQNSGFGFGVYYWMINLGALVAPLIVIWLRGMSWRYVFLASSLYCVLMLFPTVFLYKDPAMPESRKSLKEVLGGAAIVLSDARFMLLVLLYSCFWILYFQNFGTVLWYLRDFIDAGPVNAIFASWGLPIKFDAEFVTVINAGTIVLLQVVVSWIVTKRKALPTMVAGILIGSGGFLCLALTRSVWGFIIGIAVFSIGEMTTHPKYYSYIGLVAPEDKKAVYMGYAFLYGVVGSLIGSNVGGEMYQRILVPLVGQAGVGAQLRNFWLVFAILGVFATLGLVVYNRIFAENTPVTRRKATTVMQFVYGLALLIGLAFLAVSLKEFYDGAAPWKTLIQSLILATLGGGGMLAIRKGAKD
jgi:proton-dependent oligopeptide transporter, POT family